MVNMSFNDGDGYNDNKGGTIVVNFLRFDFRNEGFPDTAEKAMLEIAKGLAANMYKGLSTP